jgi:hypothetical protein
MVSQTDFTPEEWRVLTHLPMDVVLTMAAIDTGNLSGAAETKTELSAGINGLLELGREFPDNALIQRVLQDLPVDWPSGISEEQYPVNRVVELCQRAGVILRHAPPTEAQQFKQYLLRAAERVIQAAGGVGGFQGFGRKISRMSPAEIQALKKIAAALQLPAPR